MKKVVWISPYIPYDTVRHAGGQIENYYIKKLIGAGEVELRLVSSYLPGEREQFTLHKQIRCDLVCNYDRGIRHRIRQALDVIPLFNPFDRYGNHKPLYNELMMIRILRAYRKEGFEPDILIIEWLQSLLSVKHFKKIFPKAKIVGIEEDVVIQSYTRKWENAHGINKAFARIRLHNIKREELRALKACDLIITNNAKDKALLQKYGFTKNVWQWTPYYHKYTEIRNTYRDTILFFGDMRRVENYGAAEWVIREVMPLIKDTGITFQVLGGNPPEELQKLQSERVQILGYREDLTPYFETALCLIVPLTLGAGIKIKVLEGMSAGLPVLTNGIGIEGIPAGRDRDYLHCETAQDYAAAIRKLAERSLDPQQIGTNARRLLAENMDYETSADEFVRRIADMQRI